MQKRSITPATSIVDVVLFNRHLQPIVLKRSTSQNNLLSHKGKPQKSFLLYCIVLSHNKEQCTQLNYEEKKIGALRLKNKRKPFLTNDFTTDPSTVNVASSAIFLLTVL